MSRSVALKMFASFMVILTFGFIVGCSEGSSSNISSPHETNVNDRRSGGIETIEDEDVDDFEEGDDWVNPHGENYSSTTWFWADRGDIINHYHSDEDGNIVPCQEGDPGCWGYDPGNIDSGTVRVPVETKPN